MATLSEQVLQAWEEHEGPIILTTVSEDGIPNCIYATCVGRYDESHLIVADNYFQKTRANALGNNKNGALLFITKEGAAYQVKGSLEYHTEGKFFDHMKSWNPPKHPGHAALVLKVEAVFSGAKQIC